jgi:hypothetical protein
LYDMWSPFLRCFMAKKLVAKFSAHGELVEP